MTNNEQVTGVSELTFDFHGRTLGLYFRRCQRPTTSSCLARCRERESGLGRFRSPATLAVRKAESLSASPGKHQLGASVHFPDWLTFLDASGLPLAIRKSRAITIRWYLSWCRRGRVSVAEDSARQFLAWAAEEKRAADWMLERWPASLGWFLQTGRDQAGTTASVGPDRAPSASPPPSDPDLPTGQTGEQDSSPPPDGSEPSGPEAMAGGPSTSGEAGGDGPIAAGFQRL